MSLRSPAAGAESAVRAPMGRHGRGGTDGLKSTNTVENREKSPQWPL